MTADRPEAIRRQTEILDMKNMTRPDAVQLRMDAASRGLEGTTRNLARMLAVVDFEKDEDERVLGFSRAPAAQYVNLLKAAQAVVEEARRDIPDDDDRNCDETGNAETA